MSRLFKSSHVVSIDDLKQLQLQSRQEAVSNPVGGTTGNGEEEPDADTISLRDQILKDAETFAEQRVKQAAAEAEEQLKKAGAQIEQWWRERRASDERTADEARLSGYEQGFKEGLVKGEAEGAGQWQALLEEARLLVEQAYRTREQVIQEAEPFLVELSCAVAEKILGKQLAVSPDLALDLIRRALSRRREQGIITLCVSPRHFAFVQAAREELALAIDSQAELRILPDAGVKDHGCVIRSSFGSIDARVDTQLEEIKRELVQLAIHSDERRPAHEYTAT